MKWVPLEKAILEKKKGRFFGRFEKKCMEQEMTENLSIPQLKPTVKAAAAQDRGAETPCAV